MKTYYVPPILPKILLGPDKFKIYRRSNRRWYLVLNILLIVIFGVIFIWINNKELDLAMLTGFLLFSYCVPLGVLASKNKRSTVLWVLLTIMTTAMLGFVFAHILMTRIGFKHQWL